VEKREEQQEVDYQSDATADLPDVKPNNTENVMVKHR